MSRAINVKIKFFALTMQWHLTHMFADKLSVEEMSYFSYYQ